VDILWPVVLAGTVGAIFGVAVIRYRRPLASLIAQTQKEILGERGRLIWQGATPLTFALIGVGFIVIGMIGAAVAILAPEAF